MQSATEKRKRPKGQVEERLIGMDLDDYLKLIKREKDEDWVYLCEELGDEDAKYAEKQLAEKHIPTARYFYGAALWMYYLAQYGLTEPDEEKLRLYHKMCDYVAKFHEIGPWPFETVKIPYKNYNMDGYLFMPRDMKKGTPIVISIPGATGFKEPYTKAVDGMVANGFAVLYMDGPGQGTTRYFNNGYLEVEIEKAYSKIIDYVESDGRFGKIAFTGGSTGGYYVPRVVGTDKRIAACAINGGTYYPQTILNYDREYLHKFAVLSGVSDAEMEEIFPKMSLEGLAENIECPLLVQHGEADPLFLVEDAKKIYDEAKSKDKTFISYPGAWHCCAGEMSKAGRVQIDWLKDHLL